MTFIRTLPRAATLQPQPSVLNTPLYVPRPGIKTCACTRTGHKLGRKEMQMPRFCIPGRLQGEENKEWEGKTSLQNSLRSLLKVPSLSCLTFFTKLQISRLQDLSGNRKKDQENGKSLSSGQSRLESKVHHTLLLLASPGSSSSPHKALSSSCINIRPDVMK